MDEFDTKIKDAKVSIEPRGDFVDTTMQQISTVTPQRKKWGMKIWIPSAAGGVLVVVAAILFLPLLHSSQITSSAKATSKTPASTGTSVSTQSSSSTPAITSSDNTGTDNASLQSDLNGINNGMNQDSSDQSNADSNINDSSQQITVPSS